MDIFTVRSPSQRCSAECDEGSFTSRAPSRGACRGIWVGGDAKHGVGAFKRQKSLRNGRFADRNPPLLAEDLDKLMVSRGSSS